MVINTVNAHSVPPSLTQLRVLCYLCMRAFLRTGAYRQNRHSHQMPPSPPFPQQHVQRYCHVKPFLQMFLHPWMLLNNFEDTVACREKNPLSFSDNYLHAYFCCSLLVKQHILYLICRLWCLMWYGCLQANLALSGDDDFWRSICFSLLTAPLPLSCMYRQSLWLHEVNEDRNMALSLAQMDTAPTPTPHKKGSFIIDERICAHRCM